MNIAFCFESVLPSRGGCETYIASLARRLASDGHEIHLYACRWDPAVLPANLHYHRMEIPRHPRFLRPWYFTAACRESLRAASHDACVARWRTKIGSDDLVLVDRPGRGYGDDYSPWLVGNDAPMGELVPVRAAAVSEEGILAA